MRNFAGTRLAVRAILTVFAKEFRENLRERRTLLPALIHNPRNLILDEPTNGLDVMAVRAPRPHRNRPG